MSDSSGDEYHPVNEPMVENPEINPVKIISGRVFSMMDPNNTSCNDFAKCFKIQFKQEGNVVEQPTLLFRADTPEFKVRLDPYSNTFSHQNFREGNIYHLNIGSIHHIIFHRDGDDIVVMQAHQGVLDNVSKTERTKQVSNIHIDFFIDILNGFIIRDDTNESFKQSYLLLTGVLLPFDGVRYIVGMKHGSKKAEVIKGISLLRLETLTLNLGGKPKRRRTKKTKKSKRKKKKKSKKRLTKKIKRKKK